MTKDKNGKNLSQSEITEVILILVHIDVGVMDFYLLLEIRVKILV